MTIDEICKMTTRPSTLNALHACRPNHPLGLGYSKRTNFQNAYCLCAQNNDISLAAIEWLHEQIEAA